MYNLSQILKPPTRHNIIIFNLVLWFAMFLILLLVFSKTARPIKVDYIYTGAFLITLIPPVVINFYLLIPKLLKQQKYVLYLISFVVNILIWERIHSVFFKDILDTFFKDYFFISYHSNTSISIIFIIVLISTTFIKLTEDWVYYNANESKLLRQHNQIIESQLSALRSQINPHFLFNSLNVIYSMALEEKEEIKSAILQLSDVLRYIIYDADTKQVTLDKEIELLSNFIAFQKHRSSKSERVIFKKTIENGNFGIYPMLLLPLLENAYKHGDFKNPEQSIIVEMHQNKSNFTFKISNPKSGLPQNESIEDYSGFGLESIRKNLEIVYPNNHEFIIFTDESTFNIELKLF